jgi:hypothetical protein
VHSSTAVPSFAAVREFSRHHCTVGAAREKKNATAGRQFIHNFATGKKDEREEYPPGFHLVKILQEHHRLRFFLKLANFCDSMHAREMTSASGEEFDINLSSLFCI